MAHRSKSLFYFAAGAVVYGVCSIMYSILKDSHTTSTVRRAPRPNSATPDQDLPYPVSNFIPGRRDISTPLGNMRIYEFGPIDAERKVLLIHGISTPCISLASIAESLSKKGCRVMMFDLFGRGWSDAPPGPYDETLYMTQIFMALASSPISWTGHDSMTHGFSIIGYSMGGGVAANFTSYFPQLVDDLVLIAPGGILRPHRRAWQTQFLYSGIFPDSVVTAMLRSLLLAKPNDSTKNTTSARTKPPSDDIISAEMPDATHILPPAFSHSINLEAVMNWQMTAHPGFVHAVLSSYRHAPIYAQHAHWRAIGQRLDAQRAARSGPFPDPEAVRQGLRAGKVLMVVGAADNVISTPEVLADARTVLGEGNLEVLEVECGHEVPMMHGREIVEFIWRVWEGSE